jgi:type IV pilus assembly protein PilX
MQNSQYKMMKRQNGAVLVVSLFILLVLTLIGVSGMQGTVLQERMASNTRDRSLAFQSSESAMREAEAYLAGIVTTGDFDGSAGLFNIVQAEPDYKTAATWTSGATSVAGSDGYSRYYIKQFGLIPGIQGAMNMSGYGDNKGSGDVTTFRITTHGTGATTDDDGAVSEVVIRSYFGRMF